MPTFLMIFRRFPTTFQRFTKILQNLSGGHMNITEHFSKNFWRLPKISEDCQRLSRKTGRYFTYTQTNLSTTSWDKLDVSEIINIFTNEDMENAPPESQMWFRMNLGEVYFTVNTRVYIINLQIRWSPFVFFNNFSTFYSFSIFSTFTIV